MLFPLPQCSTVCICAGWALLVVAGQIPNLSSARKFGFEDPNDPGTGLATESKVAFDDTKSRLKVPQGAVPRT